jgi:hypothetical protein
MKVNDFKNSWVESEQAYQVEAIIVQAANFKPSTIFVLRKEKKEFHDQILTICSNFFSKVLRPTKKRLV